MIYVALAVIAGFTWYVMDQKERARVLRVFQTALRFAHAYATERHPDTEPFRLALAERSAHAIVAPAIAIANLIVAVAVLTDGASYPDNLIHWGASFAPVTTNGEWWRLATSIFVPPGIVGLVAVTVGFLPVAFLLERLAGRLVFSIAYVGSGIAAALVSLSVDPIGVTSGAAGATIGLYGLLLATAAGGFVRRTPLTIPLRVLARFAPAALVLTLYLLVGSPLARQAAIAALATGVILGAVLVRDVTERIAPPRRVGFAAATAVLVVVVAAVSLRGVSDVRPELARVVAFERDSTAAYDKAVALFTKGRINAAELADVIDRRIMPDLQGLRSRLKALKGVPPEHQPLVADADEYLRLRDESWRLRAEGLLKSNMRRLREADKAEKASLEAFAKVRTGNL